MKKIIYSFMALVGLLLLLQLIPLEQTNPPIDPEKMLVTDEVVMELLKKSCYDCHSYETKWPEYATIAPFSFFITSHVNEGRKTLNFSEYNTIELFFKEVRLQRAIETVRAQSMALPSYRYVHENSNLTQEEREILIRWFKEELKQFPKK